MIDHLLLEIVANPLGGEGYQFWSGIGSGSPIIAGFFIFWKKHNCHVLRCWRLSWHPDETGHPVCKNHHPDHPRGDHGKPLRPYYTQHRKGS